MPSPRFSIAGNHSGSGDRAAEAIPSRSSSPFSSVPTGSNRVNPTSAITSRSLCTRTTRSTLRRVGFLFGSQTARGNASPKNGLSGSSRPRVLAGIFSTSNSACFTEISPVPSLTDRRRSINAIACSSLRPSRALRTSSTTFRRVGSASIVASLMVLQTASSRAVSPGSSSGKDSTLKTCGK